MGATGSHPMPRFGRGRVRTRPRRGASDLRVAVIIVLIFVGGIVLGVLNGRRKSRMSGDTSTGGNRFNSTLPLDVYAWTEGMDAPEELGHTPSAEPIEIPPDS